MKAHVAEALKEDSTYAYSPTMGLTETRDYIAHERNIEGGIQISANDILFFNGLGDAISRVYRSLHPSARIIGPNPAYPTHSSAEAAHADSPHITYSLDPKNNWQPDLAEMERKIKDNPQIVGILIVNPDNPTGFVYSPKIMADIVAIAKRYNLFIISDEIYSNLVYDVPYQKLASVIGEVPGIAMRGISKEFPWPGARCGWVEFYNRDKDDDFYAFTKSLIDLKMLEVCSTSLPQKLIPKVMADKRYFPYLKERILGYKDRSEIAYDILSRIPEVIIHKPQGAFYMTLVFKEGVLNEHQTLAIQSGEIKKLVESLVSSAMPLDKRFVYYLLGATGICVVPLQSGFNSTYCGFRFTVLNPDDASFSKTIEALSEALRAYIAS
jgi:aspartate/methionine/tyrosine aminotransferase